MNSNDTSSSASKGATTAATTTTTTTSELESEEISIETTVPTDLTLSAELTDFTKMRNSLIPIKQQLEKKQLLHDLQLLKIELSQKTLLLDNLKAEFAAKSEELEEKLAELMHQKLLLQTRLESQLHIQQEDAKNRLEKTKQEMTAILQKQKELEMANALLEEKAADVRSSLHNLEITKEEYLDLMSKDPNQLSLREHVAIKIYESIHVYVCDLKSVKGKLEKCVESNRFLQNNCIQLRKNLEEEKTKFTDVQADFHKLSADLQSTKSQLRVEDYRVKHFENVKTERDKLMEKFEENNKNLATCEATNLILMKELAALKTESSSSQQQLHLLKQDKEFLSKRLTEVANHSKLVEDQLSKMSLQLEKATQAREELYERYVNTRDTYKLEFEKKLQEEMEMIQVKMTSEIDTIRKTSKEIYEQELKSLRDARDLAVSQKDKAESMERQWMDKYERLLKQLTQAHNDGTTQSAHLQGQLTLKSCELEQVKTIYEETREKFENVKLDNDKLREKVEVLSNTVRETERKAQKHINQLENDLRAQTSKLSAYEKLEQNLDDVVVQAAEVGENNEGESLITSVSKGFGLPMNVSRRLEHSFHLAKRIIILEKQKTLLSRNLEDEKSSVERLSEELAKLKELVNSSNIPNSYLVQSIQSRDDQISQLKTINTNQSQEISILQAERQKLEKNLETLASDLEKVLKNRAEIARLKKLLVTSFPGHFQNLLPSVQKNVSTTVTKKPTTASGKPQRKQPFK